MDRDLCIVHLNKRSNTTVKNKVIVLIKRRNNNFDLLVKVKVLMVILIIIIMIFDDSFAHTKTHKITYYSIATTMKLLYKILYMPHQHYHMNECNLQYYRLMASRKTTKTQHVYVVCNLNHGQTTTLYIKNNNKNYISRQLNKNQV